MADMTTLFIADLHLDAERPHGIELFDRFLDEQAGDAEALYIVGDLFDAWIGDDDPSPVGAHVADRLQRLRASGVALYFTHGNRDFLLSHCYARRAGLCLLPDPAVIMLYGQPTLLMHGDLLCSDDVAYQQFRAQTRAPGWQAQFLAQPVQARLAFAQQARTASQARYGRLSAAGTAETITDATPATIATAFARYGVKRLIHGHTHRPAVHRDDRGNTRIVLGDWYRRGSVLRVGADRFELTAL